MGLASARAFGGPGLCIRLEFSVGSSKPRARREMPILVVILAGWVGMRSQTDCLAALRERKCLISPLFSPFWV